MLSGRRSLRLAASATAISQPSALGAPCHKSSAEGRIPSCRSAVGTPVQTVEAVLAYDEATAASLACTTGTSGGSFDADAARFVLKTLSSDGWHEDTRGIKVRTSKLVIPVHGTAPSRLSRRFTTRITPGFRVRARPRRRRSRAALRHALQPIRSIARRMQGHRRVASA